MLPTAHLLTCAGREGVLADTLADFARTDWPEAPRVHAVLPEPDDPTGSTGRGHLHLLRAALDGPGTHFLLLEDDLLFNRHLHHNLLHWSLRAWRARSGGDLDYAHLYNPHCRPAEPPLAGADWFAALPRSVLGSQARLFSRAFARHVLDHFRGPGPIHDRRVVLMAAALGPVFLYRPSLVQHAPVPSTWGGPVHSAADFDPDYRAHGPGGENAASRRGSGGLPDSGPPQRNRRTGAGRGVAGNPSLPRRGRGANLRAGPGMN